MNYKEFISKKQVVDIPTGINPPSELNNALFDFQNAIVRWALRRGRAAIFADCGLGKTLMQLVWADTIGSRVIIAAPLAVAQQTVREGARFGIECKYLREDDYQSRIVITNYEMLEHFSPSEFDAIVLDESSILKSFTGKFRSYVTDIWGNLKYRLACTATPAPNDYMELGNHSEFLGIMPHNDMLSRFFVHDPSETQKWRLKGHAESEFWKWMCSWSIMLRNPSDLGFDGSAFILPTKHVNHVVVDDNEASKEFLFQIQASTLDERLAARRRTVEARCKAAAEIVNGNPDTQFVIWCNLNNESSRLKSLIHDAVEVKGSDSIDHKESSTIRFQDGYIRALITKPSISGWGVNWQQCSNMAFVGLNDSWEQYYQAVRRCWRFGQKLPVNVNIVTANTEGAVASNIQRKEQDAEKMFCEMVKHMSDISSSEIRSASRSIGYYTPTIPIRIPSFL